MTGCIQVEGFRFKDKQNQALASGLLQRQCVSVAMGLSQESMQANRSKHSACETCASDA